MEALIRPELGLTFWTIACFVLLTLLLSRTAWKPLLQAVEERERAIKHDRHTAETARAEAEKLKAEFEAKLSELKGEIGRRLDEARAMAQKEQDVLIEAARKSAGVIVDSARALAKNRVAELSVLTAERIMMKQLDHRANTDLASRYLAELEKERPDLKLECK